MIQNQKSKIIMRGISAAVVALVVAFALIISISYAKDRGKICKGVTIYGEDFSRLTKEQYDSKIKSLLKKMTDKEVTFSYENETATISLAKLAYTLDATKTYDTAYRMGRSGNFLANWFHKVGENFGRKTAVTPSADINKEKCSAELQTVVENQKGKVKEHDVVIDDEAVIIHPGHSGLAVKGDYQKKTLEAIQNQTFLVKVTLTTQKPKDIDIEALAKAVYRDAANATCTSSGKTMEVVPAVSGRSMDTTIAKEKLEGLAENGKTITIPLMVYQPEISTAAFKAALFKNTLGSGSSVYNSAQTERTTNVRLAANYINGVIIAPGKTFSYNKSVGPRTAERGFKNAQIYVNNAVEEGMGGGICQVSSTLYNAVLKADLTVTQRKAHSLPVTYVPLGQDATVSYGSVDFCFKNDSDYPIKVIASAASGKVNVSLIGTQIGAKKEVVIVNEKKETLTYKTENVNDATLLSGTTKVLQRGKNGSVIATYKKVYQNGALIETKFLHNSRYNAVTEKIAVGTGAAAASSTEPEESTAPESSATPEAADSTQVPLTTE